MKRSGQCHSCGECCKSVRITAVLSEALRQHRSLEELKLYYNYHGMTVEGTDPKNDFLFISISISCKQLDNNNRCLIHDSPQVKPLLCHLYPSEVDHSCCGYTFS